MMVLRLKLIFHVEMLCVCCFWKRLFCEDDATVAASRVFIFSCVTFEIYRRFANERILTIFEDLSRFEHGGVSSTTSVLVLT